jgi:uncharacterized protein (DUF1015 family)
VRLSGARIQPFRGLLYDQAKCGDLATVVAPPYDLIGPERQAQLYARSPYNIVRLELGRDVDRYASAAQTLNAWIAAGVLERAAAPAIYFYSQIFEIEGRRIRRDGLIARVQLEEFSAGRIVPHERTFAAAKEDRLRLLSATATQLSPIFGLYTGSDPELEQLRERLRERAAMLTVTDDLGIENQLRTIDSPGEIAAVQRTLENPRILIADGHHRYETALNYRRQRRAAEGNPRAQQPYDYTMMTLVGCEDRGLVILPTHRVVHTLRDEQTAGFAARASELFEVENFSDATALCAALKSAGHGSIAAAIHGDERLYLFRLRTPSIIEETLPVATPAVRELDVSVLHAIIFERILGLRDAEVRRGGNVEYTIDPGGALAAVTGGDAAAAFLMNPPTMREIERVCDAGATMPEKSTYFHPKLLTGLVMNPLSD